MSRGWPATTTATPPTFPDSRSIQDLTGPAAAVGAKEGSVSPCMSRSGGRRRWSKAGCLPDCTVLVRRSGARQGRRCGACKFEEVDPDRSLEVGLRLRLGWRHKDNWNQNSFLEFNEFWDVRNTCFFKHEERRRGRSPTSCSGTPALPQCHLFFSFLSSPPFLLLICVIRLYATATSPNQTPAPTAQGGVTPHSHTHQWRPQSPTRQQRTSINRTNSGFEQPHCPAWPCGRVLGFGHL